MANSANLPSPFGGINQSIPKAAVKSPQCEVLFNFNVTQEGIKLRQGDSVYRALSLAQNTTAKKLINYGNSSFFGLYYNGTAAQMEVYNLATGASAHTVAIAGNYTFNTFYFNNYYYLFCEESYAASITYNGTAWGTSGYTGSGLNPVGGTVYKNRAYLAQKSEAAYWYSGIDSITGAMTKIDLSGLISEKAELYIITPITLADNVSAETLLAFIFNSGEVLFYTGTYPDSPTWSLVGSSFIGTPINYQAILPYQGDALCFTDDAIYSLRDLFLKGSRDAASLTVNANIKTSWRNLIAALRTFASYTNPQRILGVAGVWDRLKDRIIISLPIAYNFSTEAILGSGSSYFVLFNQQLAWSTHRSYGPIITDAASIVDMVTYKSKVYTMAQSPNPSAGAVFVVYEKEGSSGYVDRDNLNAANRTYDYTMLSAPIPFPKTAVYEATAIEPIIESDLYAETNWNFVADFGRQTSGDQTTNAITTSVAKPLANVGIQNITYVQVKMSGTTAADKTVGLDLYSYNVWYDAGQTGSR